ncbi:N-acetyltransferase [Streptomyces armeniacus]|uniref:N-acetyltransferase n=1 Tax=Streptomyces armeniacus TaxID=83291 RepID=A0A345XJT8_9ACTN|nr:GNAT family N-acetyltransferase [Streptomyces armeniacus]AXK31904.1 N-acetyltransferase [Streptomyces armeniacus]
MGRIAVEPIHTDRLVLSPLRTEHAHEMSGVLADPGLYAFWPGEPPTPEFLLPRYELLVAGPSDPAVSWCNWVIRLRAAERLTGFVQAVVEPSDDGLTARLAYVVGAPWQGQGIATETVRGLVDWLRGRSVDTVIADIHSGNRASSALARSTGFTATGRRHGDELRWRLRPARQAP